MKVSTLRHIILYLAAVLLLCCPPALNAQDVVVTSNGMRFKAVVVSVENDSVKYYNPMDPAKKIMTVPSSQLKSIEYKNGEIDFFEGSYQNLSEKDTITFVTGIEDANNSLMIEAITFSITNYFTENHLVLNFAALLDSNFRAEKGKIEFEFENPKHNFSMRTFKAAENILYTKFTKGYAASEKRYRKLADRLLVKIRIFSGQAVLAVSLSPDNALAMQELFRKTKID